jgi:hypothetical protein
LVILGTRRALAEEASARHIFVLNPCIAAFSQFPKETITLWSLVQLQYSLIVSRKPVQAPKLCGTNVGFESDR